MSKLTFRADDELVERVEALDASKSEIMREALRSYLDGDAGPTRGAPHAGSLDAMIADRVDALVERRLGRFPPGPDRDVNVTISLEQPAGVDVTESDGVRVTREGTDVSHDRADAGAESDTEACSQCGEPVGPDHVYCPNCGEKRSRRVFCECGDEIRTDWSFCPSCGRRTPAADVLDQA